MLDGLREAGVLPVALAYGSSDNEKLSVELGLPLLAKFRAQYESTAGAAAGAAEAATPAARQPVAASAAPEKAEPRTRPAPASQPGLRSEEHTSELQSLMRISYAVFCLKKKITNKT